MALVRGSTLVIGAGDHGGLQNKASITKTAPTHYAKAHSHHANTKQLLTTQADGTGAARHYTRQWKGAGPLATYARNLPEGPLMPPLYSSRLSSGRRSPHTPTPPQRWLRCCSALVLKDSLLTSKASAAWRPAVPCSSANTARRSCKQAGEQRALGGFRLGRWQCGCRRCFSKQAVLAAASAPWH